MTELRTLKDLSQTTIMIPDKKAKSPCQDNLISVVHVELEESRQEIIKWIKELEKNFREGIQAQIFNDAFPSGDRNTLCAASSKLGENRIEYSYQSVGSMKALLKHIFNITEEDLK